MILISTLAIASVAKVRHTCVHEEMFKGETIQVQEVPEGVHQGRFLQEPTLRNLKFYVDATYLIDVTPEHRELIVERVVPVAFDFLSNRIKVETRGQNLTLANKLCRKVLKELPFFSYMNLKKIKKIYIYEHTFNIPTFLI